MAAATEFDEYYEYIMVQPSRENLLHLLQFSPHVPNCTATVIQQPYLSARVRCIQPLAGDGRWHLRQDRNVESFLPTIYSLQFFGNHPPHPAPPRPALFRPVLSLVVAFPRVQLLVPAGESNFTVYLRAYNSVNNTMSAESSEYVVVSAAVLGSSDSLCPEDIPAVAKAEEQERSSTSPTAVELSPNASVVPGIIQVGALAAVVATVFFFRISGSS